MNIKYEGDVSCQRNLTKLCSTQLHASLLFHLSLHVAMKVCLTMSFSSFTAPINVSDESFARWCTRQPCDGPCIDRLCEGFGVSLVSVYIKR